MPAYTVGLDEKGGEEVQNNEQGFDPCWVATESRSASMDRISTDSIRNNWARIGSVKFAPALLGEISSDGSEKPPEATPKHRSFEDVIDKDLYVDYMDLKMKKKIGEGAFARVFEATYLVDGREVAVRTLNPGANQVWMVT